MARVYAWCETRADPSRADRMPIELEAAYAVERFGAVAVFGNRAASVSELRTLSTARRVADAYDARSASENWAEWAAKNKHESAILNRAALAAEGLND